MVPGQPLRWFRGNSVVTGSGPGWVRYNGILLDITPLKQAQAALRENDMRWKMAVEGFGDGSWERNFRTDEVFFSREYRAMLGYDEEALEALAHDTTTLIHPADYARTQQQLKAYLQGEFPALAIELRLRCADGSYKWVLSRGMITERDAAGRPTVLTGINTDITALKQAQEALEATSYRLSTVIDNFAKASCWRTKTGA